jgi:hypothetical protein
VFLLAALHDATTPTASVNGLWSTIGPRIVGLVIVTLVVVWISVFIVEWSRRRQHLHQAVRQSSLLDQLCATHKLDAEAQQQIESVATKFAHGDVILPFVDPRILEQAAREQPELAGIGMKLFGQTWQP